MSPEWIDYNGHMTESRYLQVFADSSDALLAWLGIDRAYHARAGSYFTVETHIMHLKEVQALEPIHTTTQILAADDKRLHVFQTIFHYAERRRARDRRADAAACECALAPDCAGGTAGAGEAARARGSACRAAASECGWSGGRSEAGLNPLARCSCPRSPVRESRVPRVRE